MSSVLPPLTLPALRGGTIDLADHAGPILVVNTASLCGFTGQYAGLQKLHTDYASRGLMVLAVPSADFGNQEHPTAAETLQVCDNRFGVTFPIAATTHVKGDRATPLFQWIAAEAGLLGRPRWNFYKYLLSRDRRLLTWFGSTTAPDSTRLRTPIEQAIGLV